MSCRLTRSKGLRDYVVGEAHCQEQLECLAGPKTEDGYNIDCEVMFEAEPRNKFDPDAVKASISGQHVGYLPKKMTGDFHAVMRARGTKGAVAAGNIRGGWSCPDEESEGAFGVKVYMEWPPTGEVR